MIRKLHITYYIILYIISLLLKCISFSFCRQEPSKGNNLWILRDDLPRVPEADIAEVLDNRYTDIPETQISVENRWSWIVLIIGILIFLIKYIRIRMFIKKKDLIGAQISIENYNDTVHADTCVSILITDISRY